MIPFYKIQTIIFLFIFIISCTNNTEDSNKHPPSEKTDTSSLFLSFNSNMTRQEFKKTIEQENQLGHLKNGNFLFPSNDDYITFEVIQYKNYILLSYSDLNSFHNFYLSKKDEKSLDAFLFSSVNIKEFKTYLKKWSEQQNKNEAYNNEVFKTILTSYNSKYKKLEKQNYINTEKNNSDIWDVIDKDIINENDILFEGDDKILILTRRNLNSRHEPLLLKDAIKYLSDNKKLTNRQLTLNGNENNYCNPFYINIIYMSKVQFEELQKEYKRKANTNDSLENFHKKQLLKNKDMI